MLSERDFQRPLNTGKKPGWRRSYKTQYRKVVLGAMVAFQSGPGLAPLLGAPEQFAEEMGVKGRGICSREVLPRDA
jgi:hypothetical protein